MDLDTHQFLDVATFTSLFPKSFSFMQAGHVLLPVAKFHPPLLDVKRPIHRASRVPFSMYTL